MLPGAGIVNLSTVFFCRIDTAEETVNHFYTVHTYLISILSLSVGEKPGI